MLFYSIHIQCASNENILYGNVSVDINTIMWHLIGDDSNEINILHSNLLSLFIKPIDVFDFRRVSSICYSLLNVHNIDRDKIWLKMSRTELIILILSKHILRTNAFLTIITVISPYSNSSYSLERPSTLSMRTVKFMG